MGKALPKGLTVKSGGISLRVEGAAKVIANLKKAKVGMGKKVERALLKAGLFLQRESQKIVPVDTGNLKNSAVTQKEGKRFNTEVFVGYTANYAIFVHEDLTARHKKGKTAKFLEGPARKNKAKIQEIIAKELSKTK